MENRRNLIFAGEPLYFQKLGFPAVGYVHTTWKTWMIRKIANKMKKIHHFIKNLVMPFLCYLVSTGAHCTTFSFFLSSNVFLRCIQMMWMLKKSYGKKYWGFFKTEKISFLCQCCRVTPVLPEIPFFCYLQLEKLEWYEKLHLNWGKS